MNTKLSDCFTPEVPDIAEVVYECLMGFREPECCLSWVEEIFVPGHPCHEEYDQMRLAYDRLLERLQETDEDHDAEEMINALLKHGKIIALEMFRCGRTYQKQLDSAEKQEHSQTF